MHSGGGMSGMKHDSSMSGMSDKSGMSGMNQGSGMMSGSDKDVSQAMRAANATNRGEMVNGTTAAAGAGTTAEARQQSMQGMMTGDLALQGMMQQWGITPEMMSQGRLIMRTTISRDNPAALLGLKDELRLMAAQANRLQEIVRKAETDARAVLSASQRTVMDRYPVEPTSMAQIHERMMTQMKQARNASGAPTGQVPTPCAMMDAMMSGASGNASPGASNPGGQSSDMPMPSR
jgi:hypothetical protein